ncbi:hypothetical protein [Nostoc sp.]
MSLKTGLISQSKNLVVDFIENKTTLLKLTSIIHEKAGYVIGQREYVAT